MNAQHTPGPWSWWPQSAGGVVTQDATGLHICVPTILPNRTANARLLAAAPDMLAALHTAVKTIRLWHDMTPPGREPEELTGWEEYLAGSPEMREITAAIAKAEGKP